MCGRCGEQERESRVRERLRLRGRRELRASSSAHGHSHRLHIEADHVSRRCQDVRRGPARFGQANLGVLATRRASAQVQRQTRDHHDSSAHGTLIGHTTLQDRNRRELQGPGELALGKVLQRLVLSRVLHEQEFLDDPRSAQFVSQRRANVRTW